MLLCLMLTFVASTKAQFSGPGSGTQNSPFLISTAEQLNEIRNDLSAYYRLNADIDLSQWINANMGINGWIPIGTEGMPFSGFLDGQGHSISNLRINRTTNVGFFGSTQNATIKNIKLTDADIKGTDNVGCLIGLMKHSDVENIEISGICVGQNNLGGLIGCVTNSITSVDNIYNYKVSNCISSINVVGTQNVGGLIGSISGKSYCHIPHSGGTHTGGGYNHYYKMESIINQVVEDCKFTGNIEGSDNIGGIIGKVDITSDAFSDNGYGGNYKYYHTSVAQSNVSVESSYINSKTTIKGRSNIGGIVGFSTGAFSSKVGGYTQYNTASANATCLINQCSSATSIKATGDNIGGIVGKSECPTTQIKASCSMGNIQAENNIGGISGIITTGKGNHMIENCYSNGNLYGTSTVGGIIGNAYSCNISKCYNSGNIINRGDYTGGIIGLGSECNVNNSVVATHKIYGEKYINRISGNTGATFTNNYANVLCEIYSKGYLMEINDDEVNGYAIGSSSLKNASFYEGMQWNFEELWTNNNTTPYLRYQTSPVRISDVITTNGFYINGTCYDNGRLFYRNSSEEISETNINNNNWSISIDATPHICLYAQAENKQPSMLTCTDIQIKPSSITLTEHELSLSIGDVHKLEYSLYPSDATSDVVWVSSNAEVAVVNTNGEVTALSNGNTTITVKSIDGTLLDNCLVHVIVPVENVILNTHELLMEKNEKVLLTAVITPSDASNKNLVWISTTPNIANVDDNGYVTANDYGETFIVVKTEDGNKVDYCKVQVIKHVSAISLNCSELTLKVGDSYTLLPIIDPFDATDQKVSWASSNPDIVSVNDGTIKAIKEGVSIIMVKSNDGSKTAICVVTVSNMAGISNTAVSDFSWVYDKSTKIMKINNSSNNDIIQIYTSNGVLAKIVKCSFGVNTINIQDVNSEIVIVRINNNDTFKIVK